MEFLRGQRGDGDGVPVDGGDLTTVGNGKGFAINACFQETVTVSRKLLQWDWVWNPNAAAPASMKKSNRHRQMEMASGFGHGICRS